MQSMKALRLLDWKSDPQIVEVGPTRPRSQGKHSCASGVPVPATRTCT
jgi:hypothetical protein